MKEFQIGQEVWYLSLACDENDVVINKIIQRLFVYDIIGTKNGKIYILEDKCGNKIEDAIEDDIFEDIDDSLAVLKDYLINGLDFNDLC